MKFVIPLPWSTICEDPIAFVLIPIGPLKKVAPFKVFELAVENMFGEFVKTSLTPDGLTAHRPKPVVPFTHSQIKFEVAFCEKNTPSVKVEAFVAVKVPLNMDGPFQVFVERTEKVFGEFVKT